MIMSICMNKLVDIIFIMFIVGNKSDSIIKSNHL